MNMTVVEGGCAQGQGHCHGGGAHGCGVPGVKVCPQCGAAAFEDMDVCYGCLHRFGAAVPAAGMPYPPAETAAYGAGLDLRWAVEGPLAGLPAEWDGPLYDDFDPADAEVDEADETGDLSEVARSPRWGLVMEWRGMRAPVALPVGGLSIGRASDNDVVLKDASVSRRHVVVAPDEGMVLVHDAGATHPATLDGEEVVDSMPWLPGSVLEICGARFSLELLDPRR
ncbi:FHA domain-containing protein [Caniella muris]|uniref:FHA domain-containing protein n=1 Tax=Caniella muris TaxID=2941502 RepID=UPI002041E217|nr:FHA domain-containing protein [Caniella muris]